MVGSAPGGQYRTPRRFRRSRPRPHLPGRAAYPADPLLRAGELRADVQELILLNCQVPRERLSDLRAQKAVNRLGVQRMQALCGRWLRRKIKLAMARIVSVRYSIDASASAPTNNREAQLYVLADYLEAGVD